MCMGERIEKFEDLEAWQKARNQLVEVYKATRESAMEHDYEFKNQIRAAALSVMNNIAEGFERWNRGEKLHAYNIARGSNGEVRSMTYAAEDLYPQFTARFTKLREDCIHVGRLISGLIASTEQRRNG